MVRRTKFAFFSLSADQFCYFFAYEWIDNESKSRSTIVFNQEIGLQSASFFYSYCLYTFFCCQCPFVHSIMRIFGPHTLFMLDAVTSSSLLIRCFSGFLLISICYLWWPFNDSDSGNCRRGYKYMLQIHRRKMGWERQPTEAYPEYERRMIASWRVFLIFFVSFSPHFPWLLRFY